MGFVVGTVVAAPLSGLAASAGTNGITASAADGLPFEFRGIIELDGRLKFSVRQVESQSSFWISLGREFRGLEVLRYNTSDKTLDCNYQGEVLTLQLAKDDGIPLNILNNHILAETVISADDIDPDAAGMQSHHVLRSKLRFDVGSRQQATSFKDTNNSSTNSSSGASRPDSTGANATESAKAESGGDLLVSPTGKSGTSDLTENEIIALQAFEKNYVAVREASRDVEIRYSVAPR